MTSTPANPPAVAPAGATPVPAESGGRRAVNALAIGHFSVDFFQGCVPAIVPYLVTERHYTYAAVGSLIFAFNLASSIVQPVFGRLADRRSMHWLLPLGIALAGLGVLLVGALENRLAASLVAIAAGCGVAAFHPEAARLVRGASGARKATAMSVFAVGGAAGFACGPLAASGVFGRFGLPWGCALLLLPLLGLVAFNLRELPGIRRATAGANQGKGGPRAPGNARRAADQWGGFALLSLAVMCRSIIFFGLSTFLPLLWLKSFHGTEAGGGRLVSLLFLNGVLGALLGGWCGDRFGHRRMVLASFAAMLPALFLLPHLPSAAALLLGTALLGVCLYLPYSVLVVLGQELLPNHVGLASGVTLGLSVTVGGLFTPVLGWLADRHGIPAMLNGLAFLPLPALAAAGLMPRPAPAAGERA